MAQDPKPYEAKLERVAEGEKETYVSDNPTLTTQLVAAGWNLASTSGEAKTTSASVPTGNTASASKTDAGK